MGEPQVQGSVNEGRHVVSHLADVSCNYIAPDLADLLQAYYVSKELTATTVKYWKP